MKKPWNITCPNCQNTCAYQGFLNCECPNYSCRYYSETQKDLVEQYENYLENIEKDLIETIPSEYDYDDSGYYVSNTYIQDDDNDTNQIPTVPYGTCIQNNKSKTDPCDLTGYYSTQNQSLNDDPDITDSFCSDDDLVDLFGIQ